MPYIDSTYPTSGRNLIFGQSFSGLFGLYAFLKSPGLFQTYVLADLSLWWDNDWVIALGEKKLSTITGCELNLLVAGRQRKPWTFMGTGRLDSLLRQCVLANIQTTVASYPDETHNSIKYKTFYDGLKLMYQYQKALTRKKKNKCLNQYSITVAWDFTKCMSAKAF